MFIQQTLDERIHASCQHGYTQIYQCRDASSPTLSQPYLRFSSVSAYTSTTDSGISEMVVDFIPHLVNCRLSTEIGHRVTSCKKLAQPGIEWKQPKSRQHSTKLFGSHHELVTGIKALGKGSKSSGRRASRVTLFDCSLNHVPSRIQICEQKKRNAKLSLAIVPLETAVGGRV